MDISLLGIVQESIFVISVFGVASFYTMLRGRQAAINLMLALYFALLISYTFPYYDALLGEMGNASTQSIVRIIIFAVFTFLSLIVFRRLSYRSDGEALFSGFLRKLLYALGITILILNFSFYTLPVTEFIDGGPVRALFSSEHAFFWWLFAPLGIMFFL